ncbi:MAG: hypoxanthine phosphoribosyltransferase [Lachnospiraceae bacterium]|nr:hypoxanthine phosphoribosyltransferase [Lachnospiraceae bacterium]MBQ9402786.1 hypoxanthine phosphoribosyltransferase [Clostridia bacterium]
MKQYTIKTLISEEKLKERIRELAKEIDRDYAGKEIHLICVLKGGAYFMTELSKYITIPVTIDFMAVSSYGSKTVSSGIVKIIKDHDEPIEGRDVLVVEDIVDTGFTLSYLLEMLRDRKPASLKLCAMLNKPDRRIREVKIDYLGFDIPDEFVVGYGLDYDQHYRNLPYIGSIKPEED